MADRHARILELRSEGWSIVRIAAELKISTQRVWQVVRHADTLALIESMMDDTLDE